VNLSPDKAAVLHEAYRALALGGEVYFSDIYCDRRLPQEVSSHIRRGACKIADSPCFCALPVLRE
jgi:hypothetical protein